MGNNDRGFKVIAVIALVIATVGLTVAYAGFTSTLKVDGTTGTVSTAWKVVWTNLSSGTVHGYANTTGATLAIDSTTNQTISGTIGTLKAPGDYITYSWNVANQGDINATLNGVSVGNLSCSPVTGGTTTATEAQATAVCNKLKVTFTYDNKEVTSGTTGLTTALNASSSIPVTMKVEYVDGDAVTINGDVSVSLATTSFVYNQAVSN